MMIKYNLDSLKIMFEVTSHILVTSVHCSDLKPQPDLDLHIYINFIELTTTEVRFTEIKSFTT